MKTSSRQDRLQLERLVSQGEFRRVKEWFATFDTPGDELAPIIKVAAANGRTAIVAYLERKGAAVNGQEVIEAACSSRNPTTLIMLLELGAPEELIDWSKQPEPMWHAHRTWKRSIASRPRNI